MHLQELWTYITQKTKPKIGKEKEMDKKDKIMVSGLVVILIFIFINIFSSLYTMHDYEERKESGNERWRQVEERILQTEEKVNLLEEEIKKWKY